MRTYDFSTSLEGLVDIVTECIECENKPHGILHDVESIVNVAANEKGVDEPCIWIVQHPTEPEKNVSLSNTMKLRTTFEFWCVEYDEEPLIAERKSLNLATRVVSSIQRNYRRIQKESSLHIISNVRFKAFYPVGEVVNIQNKSDKVPATSVRLEFVHVIDWMNCYKKR